MELKDVIARRWSPRAYTGRKVEPDLLAEVFEAARWAQSSYNEQPWRYWIATKEDGEFRALLEDLLVEGNAFAKDAYVLGLSAAKRTFTRNGKPNRVAVHDLGAANQILALRAFDLGLNTRFMAGFDVERAREYLGDDFEPVCMFVIGYATEEALRQGPGDRGRRPVSEYVFRGGWNEPARF